MRLLRFEGVSGVYCWFEGLFGRVVAILGCELSLVVSYSCLFCVLLLGLQGLYGVWGFAFCVLLGGSG